MFARLEGDTVTPSAINTLIFDLDRALYEAPKGEYYRTLGRETLKKLQKIAVMANGEPIQITFTKTS